MCNVWRCLQEGSGQQQPADQPVETSEDWVALDTGKSFVWSAQQTGTLQQQADALERLIQQQGQQVCDPPTLLMYDCPIMPCIVEVASLYDVSCMQEDQKAAEGLALAAAALESAKPLLHKAEEAQKAVQAAHSALDDISR